MKERPILFSGAMIRAILAGTKTQTRRVVKPQPPAGHSWARPPVHVVDGRWSSGDCVSDLRCPYGVPGDRLWVREAWKPAIEGTQGRDRALYRAYWENGGEWLSGSDAFSRWRPSIHMPRWASRIDLELTAVRVERVQEISEEDARAEGVDYYVPGEGFVGPLGLETDPGFIGQGSYRMGLEILWDEINGKRPGCSWEANPWVWCLSFRRLRP